MPTILSTFGSLLLLLLISHDCGFTRAADGEHNLRATDFHTHRHRRHRGHRRGEEFEYSAVSCRAYSASLDEFGAVGDGVTSNTAAFRDAVSQLSRFADYGGSLLFVPAGRWLTGSFNLTSHFTLFLHRDAILLASQVSYFFDYINYLIMKMK